MNNFNPTPNIGKTGDNAATRSMLIAGKTAGGNQDDIKTDGSGSMNVNLTGGTITGSDGSILDGATPSIKATVKNYTNANPLTVRLTDTNGDYVAASGGTQYTDAASTPTHPTGSIPVFDNAGTITAVSASNPLPVSATISTVGLATSTKQSDGSQKTQIVDGSGNVIGATSNALDINIKSGNPSSITANAGTNLNTSALALESGGNLAAVAAAIKAEDSASANADKGMVVQFLQQATPGDNAGTDGDYAIPQMSGGRLWVDASGKTLTVGSHAVTNAGTFAVQATEADGANTTLGSKADAKNAATDTTAITAMSVLKQISASVQAPPSQAVTNIGTFATQSAITAASGSIASGALASGSIASGAAVSGSIADGAVVTLGAKADAKSTATDATAITAMQVLKQISASVQAPPSQAVTNGGTFATQSAITAASGSIASGAIASGALASGSVASGAIASGAIAAGALATGATSIAANEDDASANADTGVKILAIQQSTPADTAGTNADYAMLQMSAGRLWASAKIDTALPAGSNVIGHIIADSGSTTAVTQATAASLNATVVGTGTFATQSAITAASGALASGSIASGALAAGSIASGAAVSGSIADGAVVTLGAKADAKSAATDTTAITAMQVLKQISASVQAPPSQAVTNAGTFAVQLAGNQPINLSQVAGNTTVAGGTPGLLGVGGSVATNVAINANPLNLGAQAVSAENSAVTTARQVQLVADLVGKLIVLPYANPENFVSGAISSAMTGTTTTSLIAAPAAGLRNYITQITVSNSHATVGTDIIIQDGSGGTTLYVIPSAPAFGGATITFPTPLRQPTTGLAIFCANVTTGSNTKVSASGYKGA